ncbi:GntR family transcriptional regulator [Arthrobacter sp. NPDC090010]|uniref:GntR family transcriptional regulator n=1 Tax=Arthrobacter sp. NPDC090010 TaxID=3363942 RepID=UPI003817FA06
MGRTSSELTSTEQAAARLESDRVVETLRREIVLGILPAGEALVERSLGERFGVSSRLPIREALRRLKAEALIDQAPRRRATVREFSGRDLANTAEVFEIIDVHAVRLAALRRNHADLAAMKLHVDGSKQALLSGDRTAQSMHARGFRSAIFAAAKNPALLEVRDRIDARVWRMVEQKVRQTDPGSLYTELFAAISDADATSAVACFSSYMTRWKGLWSEHAFVRIDAQLKNPIGTAAQPGPAKRRASKEPDFAPEFHGVLNTLRTQILDGRRSAGEVLSERLIGQEFGLSRSPVTEAIDALVLEGLAIAPTNRSAALVRGVPPEEVADFLGVCTILDTLATRLAAERASSAQIEHMRRLVDEEDHASKSGDARLLMQYCGRWRVLLHEMSSNDVLADVGRLVQGRLQLTMGRTKQNLMMARSHRLIFEAIESRQPEVAEEVVRRALSSASLNGISATV